MIDSFVVRLVNRRDWQVGFVLAAVTTAARLPFLPNFDFVSFDGTYYISQARALWSGAGAAGAFPIGYPFFVSLVLPFFEDGTRAGQLISFLAGIGALLVFFRLGTLYMRRQHAFYAAVFLAVNPIFIRMTSTTFSESLYILWVLLGLLFYAREKFGTAGIALGIAAITRPEALAVAGGLVLLRLWRRGAPAGTGALALAFVAVYSINVMVHYQSTGDLEVLPKRASFGSGLLDWRELEATVDPTTGVIDRKQEDRPVPGAAGLLRLYADKLPVDLYMLSVQLAFVVFLLGAYGFTRRPTFMLATYIPFLIAPAFTFRSDPRFIVPYVPITILYAFIALDMENKPRRRQRLLALVALCAIIAGALNIDHLVHPTDERFPEAKRAGIALRDIVQPGDRLADRKPYIAFYANAEYVEIPTSSYNGTLDYLLAEDVRFLSLNIQVMRKFRPLMTPLLVDAGCIAGELRYQQLMAFPEGLIVYERARDRSPLEWRRITRPSDGRCAATTWSPDNTLVAYAAENGPVSDLYVVGADGKAAPQPLVSSPARDEGPAWSPDGRKLAFASTRSGNWDVFVVDVTDGGLARVTGAPGFDAHPEWTPDARGLFICSDREGVREIWHVPLVAGPGGEARPPRRIPGTAGAEFPACSPGGDRLAYVRPNEGLFLLDLESGKETRVPELRAVTLKPSWSPDGRFVAVTGSDWGSTDVYIVSADGQRYLLLTKNAQAGGEIRDGQPSWSPDGRAIAVTSDVDRVASVYVLTGIEPYLERLESPLQFTTVAETPTN